MDSERQLANLALFDSRLCDVGIDLTLIESEVCRAIVEACLVARGNGMASSVDRETASDDDLLAWKETILRACIGGGLQEARVRGYLRESYKAEAQHVYITTEQAWKAITDYRRRKGDE